MPNHESPDHESLDCDSIADEFGLGRVIAVAPLPGGHSGVVRLTTQRGDFVVKPSYDPLDVELCERAGHALRRGGIRQAMPLRTTDGRLTDTSGRYVLEFIPGEPVLHPSPAQAASAMRHVAEFHAAIEQVPVPKALDAKDTLWTRVLSPAYLAAELPGLIERPDLPADGRDEIMAALRYLTEARPLLQALPRQLIHGDIGPDNVVMDGDDVVAIIDFTPYHEPFVFAFAVAVYWYHAHGHEGLDPAAIRASLAAASAVRPWTADELAAWPAMLVRESLSRLAVYLSPGQPPGPRYQAALLIARSLGT
jgi:Ser/Thr protein kinase RdoA (MazF antagonist)